MRLVEVYLGEDEVVRDAFRRQEGGDEVSHRASLSTYRPQCKRVHDFLSVDKHEDIYTPVNGGCHRFGVTCSSNARRGHGKFSVAVWCSGSALVTINVVILHRARLILGWVRTPFAPSRF